MGELEVAAIGTLNQGQRRAVREIYEEAFPAALRVPFTELIKTGEVDRMFVALDRAMPAGFAALRMLPSASWTFLRYFAVAAPRRSQGAGRQFWRLVQAAVNAAGWPDRIVFEGEEPGEAGDDDPERLVRERRLRFWAGCGARLLPVPGYVLPDYTGCGGTEPILLMAGDPGEGSLWSPDELMSLVLAIYPDRYGLAGNDPLVTEAL